MLNRIIEFSLKYRGLVLLATAGAIVAGVLALRKLDVDAFPDVTPVQVQVNTVAPALGPEEIEQQITMPIEQVLSGMPKLTLVRSISKFGLSQVVLTFEDGTDIYFARQLISQRLAQARLPAGIDRPELGPVSTGLGEVFHYILSGKTDDSTGLRTVHDWTIKPQLRTVPGTAEINSWGGYERQYQVRVFPEKIAKYGLTFEGVVEAVGKNNRNVGGGVLPRGREALLVHGVGRIGSVEEIRAVQIGTVEGKPIRLDDVAEVAIGHVVRRGAVTADGKGEVVLGLGFMLMGENSHNVTVGLRQRLDEVKKNLPRDVKVQAVYDRTELIDQVIDTVYQNLFEGGLLVIAVLFAFLGNLRAAFVVALAIPLSMMFAFSGMWRFGIAASLLSLGAIDFGLIVDSSVVMVENCVRHLAHNDGKRHKLDVIRDAAVEVRKPTMFGELIILIVYLPILTLEGVEGKLFRPMALTVIFALAGSMLMSLTLMPALVSYFLPGSRAEQQPLLNRFCQRLRLSKALEQLVVFIAVLMLAVCLGLVVGRIVAPLIFHSALVLPWSPAIELLVGLLLAILLLPNTIEERDPLLLRLFKAVYIPVLRLAMRFKLAVIGLAVAVLFVAYGLIAPNLGAKFVPKLSEGAIAINVVRLAGTDLEESIRANTEMEKVILATFPDEVDHVWSRVGSPEVATDPMGTELTDVFITLKPRERWKRARTQAELTVLLEKELRRMPGQKIAFTQPIEMRINEMVSGVRTDVGVKIFHDDFEVLVAKAQEIERVLRNIPGAADVSVEQITGQPVLQVKVKQDALALYGVPAKAVLDLIESIGGQPLGQVVEGQFFFPLTIRVAEKYRASPEAVRDLQVTTSKGDRLPLERLADIEVIKGPSTITREWGQRRITVTCNVRGRDLASFVDEAQQKVTEKVPAPPGRYRVAWGGQFENLIRARERLMIVVPIALALIFTLLYLTYRNIMDTLRVFTGVPFAWVGGIFALWWRDMPFSISAAIGFVALSGVAVLDDMILVSYIRQLRRKGMGLEQAVEQAAITRLRPVLMTTLVASLGFVPMAFGTGVGSEVQRPLATVVIGGVISAMVMSLLVLRVLYVLFKAPVRSGEATMPEVAESPSATPDNPV